MAHLCCPERWVPLKQIHHLLYCLSLLQMSARSTCAPCTRQWWYCEVECQFRIGLNPWENTIWHYPIHLHKMDKCGRGRVSNAMNCPTQGKSIARNECDKHCCDAIDTVCQSYMVEHLRKGQDRTDAHICIQEFNKHHFNFATVIT